MRTQLNTQVDPADALDTVVGVVPKRVALAEGNYSSVRRAEIRSSEALALMLASGAPLTVAP